MLTSYSLVHGCLIMATLFNNLKKKDPSVNKMCFAGGVIRFWGLYTDLVVCC